MIGLGIRIGNAGTNLVGPTVIYGLRFDGSNDTLTGSLSEGNDYLVTIVFAPKGTVSRTVYGQFSDGLGNNRVVGINNDSDIIALTEPNGFRGDASIATVPDGLHTLVFNVNTLGATLDGTSMSVNDSTIRSDSGTNQFSWGDRVSGGFPAASDVFSITAGSTVMNDANSWAGKTISGATRIQSVDGGINWTVV